MSENGQSPNGAPSKPSSPKKGEGYGTNGNLLPENSFKPGPDPRRNMIGPRTKKNIDRIVKEEAGKLAVSMLMEARVEEEAEMILRPYFAALRLEPEEKWSARTKLDFHLSQTSVAEKLLNRVEGMPVQRQRNVDGDGKEAKLPQIDALPSSMVEKLLIAVVTGKASDAEPSVVEVEADEIVQEMPSGEQ